MAKVGRNNPCPCGSGAKYKKCCLNNPTTQPMDSLDRLVYKYGIEQVITSLSALLVFPENLNHIFSIESAIQYVSNIGDASPISKEGLTTDVLLSALDCSEIISGLRRFEDPPEGLYSENICFTGGNYTIFPGVGYWSGFTLQCLLKAAFWDRDGSSLPSEFSSFATACIGVLTISEAIAEKLDNHGWNAGLEDDQFSREYFVGDPRTFQRNRVAVSFHQTDLSRVLMGAGVPYRDIRPFIHSPEETTTSAGDSHALLVKPLVRYPETLVVAQPTSIPTAIRHQIIMRAQDCSVISELGSRFHQEIRIVGEHAFKLLNFHGAPIELPNLNRVLSWYSEDLYQIDRDKLAYVQYITDSFDNYSEPYGQWPLNQHFSKILERQKIVFKHIADSVQESETKVFHIVILGGVCRFLMFASNELSESSAYLCLQIEELQAISRLQKYDALTLWKYAEAKKRFKTNTRIRQFCELDAFSFYREHGHSFYLGDDIPPHLLSISSDYGRQIKIDAVAKTNMHVALMWASGGFVEVVSRWGDEIPIFVPMEHYGESLEQVVEASGATVWVRPIPTKDPGIPGAREEYFHSCEMLSYWIWQLLSAIETSDVPQLRETPILVDFDFADLDYWIPSDPYPDLDTSESPNIGLTVDRKSRRISLSFPNELCLWMGLPDNRGERFVISVLVDGLNLLSQSESAGTPTNAISPSAVEQIAPIGMKKINLRFDVSNKPQLNHLGLPRPRRLTEGDIDTALENLVHHVNRNVDDPFEVGLVPGPRYGELIEQICNSYLQRIFERVADLHYLSLIEYLIVQNECVTFSREHLESMSPTQEACYFSPEKQAKIIAEESGAITQTAIAIRFLLEILACTPVGGGRKPSSTDMDELLALSYCFTRWGYTSDEIRCRVFASPLSILGSGRIGVEDAGRAEAYGNFLKSQSIEMLERLQNSYSDKFGVKPDQEEPVAPTKTVEEMGELFLAEFGYSLNDYSLVISCLIVVGQSQGGAMASMPLKTLIRECVNASKLRSSTVEKILSDLTLLSRKSWSDIPNGYDESDILPHRFGRRLSYVRRPLFQYKAENGEDTVLWGSRHVDVSMQNLLALVTEGRMNLNHAQSEKMKSYVGSILDGEGKAFEKAAYSWANETFSNFRIEKNVPIGPSETLDCEDDLGDLDLVIIDENNHRFYAFECKNIRLGRTPHEISSEMDSLIRGVRNTNKLSRVQMHAKRINWLHENWALVAEALKLDSEDWTIVPAMFTSREIAGPYIEKSSIPFVSQSRLARDSIAEFDRLISSEAVRVGRVD